TKSGQAAVGLEVTRDDLVDGDGTRSSGLEAKDREQKRQTAHADLRGWGRGCPQYPPNRARWEEGAYRVQNWLVDPPGREFARRSEMKLRIPGIVLISIGVALGITGCGVGEEGTSGAGSEQANQPVSGNGGPSGPHFQLNL